MKNKKNEILDCAQLLIQKRGYNGFSYADISEVVGIRKASIHHYFPAKDDLAVAVIERYREDFSDYLLKIGEGKDWHGMIASYAEAYRQVLEEEKLCLCGMLASDIDTLPEKARDALRHFFRDNVRWLGGILIHLNPALSDPEINGLAWQIINMLQGAVIMARSLKDVSIFTSSVDEMLKQLGRLS